MSTARTTVGLAARSGIWIVAALLSGCSGSGGSFTLFPTADHLLKSTDFVRREVPRRVPVPRELEKTVLSEYILQPGDVLVVEPTALDSPVRFPADQTILPDGTIDLARYGRLIVAGKTIEQVEADIMAAVRAVETGPVDLINVRLVSPQSAVYYVLGEVSSPGSFPLVGRETVLDALVAAGGLSDRASMCNIILSRPSLPDGCRIVLPVCYRQIVQLGDTTTNYQVMPGDRIYVATRSWRDSCFGKRACPLCKGQQCPCPSPAAAVAPALPTITPPQVMQDAVQPLPELEPIEMPAAPPEEMPSAPSARRSTAEG
ncbi:MAG TPA: polysaccharide biosynthesis/export family protein [Pirellulales bacterium]|nr:polysaccharide biosynthesis/export family protein [Pirellulales bacterium]